MTKTKTKLQFGKSIISTLKENLSSKELIDRLGSLHEELSTADQGTINLNSVDRYRSDLINKKLLKSKDVGVQAFTACCLSDILRLYAPDAPYTDTELTDIFKLFFSQFKLLTDPENGYYIQQTYLITKLLEVRSIVLITDLPNSAKLVEELFQTFYDPANNSFQPRMFNIISGLLGEVIAESDSISMPVLKLVFNKFLTHNSDNTLKGLQVSQDPSFEFSVGICQTHISRLGRHFTKFYSEILYGITGKKSNEDEDKVTSIHDPGYRTLVKLHKLTARIWEYVPELVGSVVGFVYQELCSDNELFRIAATKLIGNILAIESTTNFTTTHTDTYNTWLSKIADISTKVRITWVKAIPDILSVREDISEDICKGLAKTLIDSDHKVRLASVETFGEIPTKRVWKCISNNSVYTGLLHLTREKTKEVREKSIEVAAKFYADSLKNVPLTPINKDIWEVVNTIPSNIFNLYYINDKNINYQVDMVVLEYLLPLEGDSEQRVKRLLNVISHFDKKAFFSFYAFNKRQIQMSTVVTKFVDFCDVLSNNNLSQNGDLSSKLDKTVAWLVSGLPTQFNNVAILNKFLELKQRRILHLIKKAVAQDSDYTTVKNSIVELFNRLRDQQLFAKQNVTIGSSFTREDFFSVFKILIYRAAPLIYNASNIPLLLDTGNSSSEQETSLKRQLIENISTVNPSIFKDQINSLKDIVKNPDRTENDSSKEMLTMTDALKTIYKISKTLKDHLDFNDTFFFDKVEDFAIYGEPTEAKYATKLLGLTPSVEGRFTAIKNSILPLDLNKSNNFPSNVVVLSEIIRLQPHLLDDNSTDIVSYLIKEVLLVNQVVGDSKKEVNWVDDAKLNTKEYAPLSAKLFSLKLFTNKLRSIASDVETDPMAKAFTEKTVKLFFYLIASGGELISEYNKEHYPTPSNYQTKLRCCAGLQVLKLAKVPSFNKFIKPEDVGKLINLVEDESLEVRKAFVDKLKDYIASEFISIKFLPLVFFMAYEPDVELKSNTKTWINFTFNKESFKRGTFFERALPRLIHSIAHHPDVVESINGNSSNYLNGLTTAIDYIIFYLDSIANEENISLLYYLAGRIKQYVDGVQDDEEEGGDDGDDGKEPEGDETCHDKSCNIYTISELAQLILGELKEQKNWNLPVYPGKLNLPSDLFMPFASIDEAQKNTFKTYLKEEHIKSLKTTVKVKVGHIVSKSQTQKQKLQKRKLTSEYQQSKKKARVSKKGHNGSDDEESGDAESADEYYVPSSRSKTDNQEPIRKSKRQKREVRYKDEDDEDSEEVLG